MRWGYLPTLKFCQRVVTASVDAIWNKHLWRCCFRLWGKVSGIQPSLHHSEYSTTKDFFFLKHRRSIIEMAPKGLFMSTQTNQNVFWEFRIQNKLKIVPGDKASSENPLMTYRELDRQQRTVMVGSHQMPWLSPSTVNHLAAGTCNQATAFTGIKEHWAFSLSEGHCLQCPVWNIPLDWVGYRYTSSR